MSRSLKLLMAGTPILLGTLLLILVSPMVAVAISHNDTWVSVEASVVRARPLRTSLSFRDGEGKDVNLTLSNFQVGVRRFPIRTKTFLVAYDPKDPTTVLAGPSVTSYQRHAAIRVAVGFALIGLGLWLYRRRPKNGPDAAAPTAAP